MLRILTDQTGGFLTDLIILAVLCIFLASISVTLGSALEASARGIASTSGQQSEGSSI